MRRKPRTEYEKQREIWYKKLKDSGFYDIERDENTLKEYSFLVFSPRRALLQNGGWQAKAAYYSMAERFLQEYPFNVETRQGRRERIVWEYHSNAISIRDIVKVLTGLRWRGITRTYVWGIVKSLRNKMFALYMNDGREYRE